MSQSEDHDVRVEIQRTLAAINDVTIKIKKELTAITDLVGEKGRLNTAVNDANETLLNEARRMGIDITALLINGKENDDQSENFAMPMTANIDAEKLSSLLEDTEAQSS